ncbi:MAG: cache domain-containing protein [Desulfobacteraceae bacterium]|nr:cache domain-containing protein [Desulfobacteraceae bacterium]
MFKTIRSKMLLLVVSVITLISVTLIFITISNFQREMTDQHKKFIKETLSSTMRIIDNKYNELLSYEIDFISDQRSLMANVGTSILAMIDSFYDLQDKGLLSEKQAKELCLIELREYRYQNDKYFFAYDMNLIGLSHPDKEMIGERWSGFEDLKKRDALDSIRDAIQTEKSIFTVFMWPRLKGKRQVKQMGYFLYYPKWKWIVGTTYELGHLEKISLNKEKNTLVYINKTISKMKLNNTGCIFIFNGSGKIIIHTSDMNNLERHHAGETINKLVQERLIKAADDPETSIEYFCSKKDQKDKINIAYVNYYKYMDWYVVALADKQALLKPVSDIAKKQYLILLIVLFFGIAVAVFISRKISYPLSLLTRYSINLSNKDLKVRDNKFLESIRSESQSDEIKQLANAFAYMESELGKNIRNLEDYQKNLEELVDIRTKELTDTNKSLKNEIVERKRAEQKLSESEKKYRYLFVNAPSGMFEVDLVHSRFVSVNEIMCEYSGYSEHEFLSMNPLDLLTKESKDLFVDRFEKVSADRRLTDSVEYNIVKKDGQELCVLLSNDFIYEKEQLIGARAVAHDITDRKQAEEEKIHAQKIAGENEKLALVGQIAGKMAHDFNNVLGVIMGNTELSLIECEEIETRKTLELILEQTLRGKNLTKNLVAFAKDQELKQEFFMINEKIDLVLNLLKKDLEGIELFKENASGLAELLADPGMIEHALVNLIYNSIHALSIVEDPRITIRTYSFTGNICFEIEDNGCGIPEEYLERIYEPSFTLKGIKDVTSSYKKHIKGTGYGMSNVKKYIEQHKGNIKVASEPAYGTKFTVCLPVITKESIEERKN